MSVAGGAALLRLSHQPAETSFDAALAEASFRGVLEHAPEAVLVLHRDRTILYANPAAGALFGFAKGCELLGRSLALLLHPDDHDAASARLERVLATGEPTPWSLLRLERDPGAVELRGTRVVCSGRPAVLVLLRRAEVQTTG
jgi:PAS domain S-box-containing protein